MLLEKYSPSTFVIFFTSQYQQIWCNHYEMRSCLVLNLTLFLNKYSYPLMLRPGLTQRQLSWVFWRTLYRLSYCAATSPGKHQCSGTLHISHCISSPEMGSQVFKASRDKKSNFEMSWLDKGLAGLCLAKYAIGRILFCPRLRFIQNNIPHCSTDKANFSKILFLILS